jgi:hypothetical protein
MNGSRQAGGNGVPYFFLFVAIIKIDLEWHKNWEIFRGTIRGFFLQNSLNFNLGRVFRELSKML